MALIRCIPKTAEEATLAALTLLVIPLLYYVWLQRHPPPEAPSAEGA